jgi:ribosomal protein S18 acetylase RimI-like enzyme
MLPPDYSLRRGTRGERSLLLKFLQSTYLETNPGGNFTHLTETVEQYFSSDTPVWWVDWQQTPTPSTKHRITIPVGCLWLGIAIDQITGDRHTNIFLLYVMPEHRRQGIGTALMHHAEVWAIDRGDRQIGLQVFQTNHPALNLYKQMGYTTQSLWMIKTLPSDPPKK